MKKSVFLILFFFLLAGCTFLFPRDRVDIATPTVLILPTNTKLPTNTITPVNTSTQTPTATSTLHPTVTSTYTITPFPEPEGCLRPPDDYSKITINGQVLNMRTYAMLEHAAELYDGQLNILTHGITQGSFTTEVEESFGTHAGGGAVDLSVLAETHYEILYDEIPALIEALRIAGFAAWFRDSSDLYPGSPPHIHAIAIGDDEMSAAAYQQLVGEFGYFRGYNGLPMYDGEPLDEPIPDEFGGPVVCQWMLDIGYEDYSK